MREDRGAKCSLCLNQMAAETWLWPHFCDLDVAKWPHPGGDLISFDFVPSCPTVFAVWSLVLI